MPAEDGVIEALCQRRSGGIAGEEPNSGSSLGLSASDGEHLLREVDAVDFVAKFTGKERKAAGPAAKISQP